MSDDKRISILVSSKVDEIITRLSFLSGVPKTALIQSALMEKMPDYLELMNNLERAKIAPNSVSKSKRK